MPRQQPSTQFLCLGGLVGVADYSNTRIRSLWLAFVFPHRFHISYVSRRMSFVVYCPHLSGHAGAGPSSSDLDGGPGHAGHAMFP